MHNQSADRTARLQRLLVVSLIALLLGFVGVVQLRSQAAVVRSLAAQDDTSVALLINDLNRANNQLLQQSAALSQQEATLSQALVAGGADSKAIEKELMVLREVNGEVPVHGPGLEIHINGRLQDFELQDALNGMRNAGGEAFALNGVRIVSGTPIESTGQTLKLGGRSVSAPYVLVVIGNQEQLAAAAELAASSLQTRVQVDTQRKPDLAITEVTSAHPLIYAQLGK
jgi:uncharacterized protein YlxW (UPF0749 family)